MRGLRNALAQIAQFAQCACTDCEACAMRTLRVALRRRMRQDFAIAAEVGQIAVVFFFVLKARVRSAVGMVVVRGWFPMMRANANAPSAPGVQL